MNTNKVNGAGMQSKCDNTGDFLDIILIGWSIFASCLEILTLSDWHKREAGKPIVSMEIFL